MERRQLNGWKEIATFFGKSTRTVQRWEGTLELPVRRIRSQGGEIIYAFTDELAGWRENRGGINRVIEQGGDDEPGDIARPDDSGNRTTAADRYPTAPPASEEEPAHNGWPGLWPPHLGHLVVLAVAALLIVAGVALWSRLLHRAGSVSSAEFRGNQLVALDATGRELWAYRFERPLWSDPARLITGNVGFLAGAPPLMGDLDGDGRPEFVAIATYGDLVKGPQPQEIFCFAADGRLKWRCTLDFRLSFAGRPFGAPWQAMDYLISKDTSRPALWLAASASPWWPTVIVRFDAAGTPELRYVSSGAIYRLAELRVPDGWRILAGGVNNEFAAAALAVLREDGPAAQSPQTPGSAYACDNCPTGSPAAYFTFPRTDVNEAEGYKPYNAVGAILRSELGTDIVTIESLQYGLSAYYRLTPDLRVTRVTLSDSTAHALLEGLGRLKHKEADCPARTTGVTIRTWTAADGWRTQAVPVR